MSLEILPTPTTEDQTETSTNRVYYLLEVEADSAIECALRLIVGTQFQRPGDVEGLMRWEATERPGVAEALAEFAENLGVLPLLCQGGTNKKC